MPTGTPAVLPHRGSPTWRTCSAQRSVPTAGPLCRLTSAHGTPLHVISQLGPNTQPRVRATFAATRGFTHRTGSTLQHADRAVKVAATVTATRNPPPATRQHVVSSRKYAHHNSMYMHRRETSATVVRHHPACHATAHTTGSCQRSMTTSNTATAGGAAHGADGPLHAIPTPHTART